MIPIFLYSCFLFSDLSARKCQLNVKNEIGIIFVPVLFVSHYILYAALPNGAPGHFIILMEIHFSEIQIFNSHEKEEEEEEFDSINWTNERTEQTEWNGYEFK